MNRLRAAFGAVVPDVFVLVGFGLIAYGAGQYSPPLTPIIVGIGLLLTVRLGVRG